MKKLLAIVVFGLLLSNTVLASEFCEGFKRGYIAGYKKSHNTGYDPYTPYCPYQPYKSYSDPQSDFEHGYVIGYEKGFGS